LVSFSRAAEVFEMEEAIINPSPDNLVSLLFTAGHKIKSKALPLVFIQTKKFKT
jgi:hypothetical protein